MEEGGGVDVGLAHGLDEADIVLVVDIKIVMDEFEFFLPGEIPPVGEVLLEYTQIVLVPLGPSLNQYFLQPFQLDMNSFLLNAKAFDIFKPDVDDDLLHKGIAISVREQQALVILND